MNHFFSSKKFKESPDTAVFTTVHVMKEGSPIVLVSHELDGDWQFMGAETFEDYRKVIMVVTLRNVIELDKSVLKVADLPMGYRATRSKKSGKWAIGKIAYNADELKEFGYYCSKCNCYHKDIPMAYGADAPYQYYLIPEEQRADRCLLGESQCIIDDEQYYLRGQIELSVEDKMEPFKWSVWVSVTAADYERTSELWEDENRVLRPAFSGILASQLEPYPQTLGLPVKIITRQVGLVPGVELEESTHPLYLEQESGIDMERVTGFARELLYNH